MYLSNFMSEGVGLDIYQGRGGADVGLEKNSGFHLGQRRQTLVSLDKTIGVDEGKDRQ